MGNNIKLTVGITLGCLLLGVLNEIFNAGGQSAIDAIGCIYLVGMGYVAFSCMREMHLLGNKILILYAVLVFLVAAFGLWRRISVERSNAEARKEKFRREEPGHFSER